MPLYPLYALLFADSGLSAAEISGLFVLWSTVGVAAEVPCGVWADRHSRRAALVLAGLLQAIGYLAWIGWPGLSGFALGFVLWGLGGALSSGSIQALVYDGLDQAGAPERYAGVMGRCEAAALAVQVPVAGAASVLFDAGGYVLVGWASVGVCLGASALALGLPEPPRHGWPSAHPGYRDTLRAGMAEVAGARSVRRAAVALAVLGGFDGLEEYFPLLAAGWGVPVGVVPVALLGISLAGALGAALGGPATAIRPIGWIAVIAGGAGALMVSGMIATPLGLVGLALLYGSQQLVLVVADARLQAEITTASRATVTSLAALGTELSAIGLYAAWALGGLTLVAALMAIAAPLVGTRLSAPNRGR